MIVKIQFPLNAGGDEALIYDESREKVFEQIGLSFYLEGLMDGKVKKFFYAEIIEGHLNILEEAPWQEW
ncbi:MAG: hypothetical protein KAR06_03255 [Deltaproteobacteria bacterium]|nr:hypothetical protein [Deltaproteobacteria bacterium]